MAGLSPTNRSGTAVPAILETCPSGEDISSLLSALARLRPTGARHFVRPGWTRRVGRLGRSPTTSATTGSPRHRTSTWTGTWQGSTDAMPEIPPKAVSKRREVQGESE